MAAISGVVGGDPRCDGSGKGTADCAGAPHQPTAWLQRFNLHGNGTADPDMYNIRRLRLEVQQQTLDACARGSYRLPDGTVIEIQPSPPLTLVQDAGCGEKPPRTPVDTSRDGGSVDSRGGRPPCVQVRDSDCLTEALLLRERGLRVAVLNMANAYTPGGGWEAGAGAQEENLHRRSNLHCFLADATGDAWRREGRGCYPIPDTGALYSPQVCVLRGPEAAGYPFLPQPQLVDVLSCAARAHPQTVMVGGEQRLVPHEAALLSANTCNMLALARTKGAQALVLSALGCGAFCNPPKHVAEVFKEQLVGEFADAFEEVVFAIFNDHNAYRSHNPEGNFVLFQRVFADLDSDHRKAVTELMQW